MVMATQLHSQFPHTITTTTTTYYDSSHKRVKEWMEHGSFFRQQCNGHHSNIITCLKNGAILPTMVTRRGQVYRQNLNFSNSHQMQPSSRLFFEKQRRLKAIPVRALNQDSTGITPEAPQGNATLSSQSAPKVLQRVSVEKPINASYQHWNFLTEQLAASATFAFLLLQLPQIILNTKNLLAGNNAALFAVPWMGLLTGLLGNLSLLSYFAGKKEKGAMIVQAVGVLSTFLVQVQLAIGGAMPVPVFIATAIAVAFGYILNFLNYNNLLSIGLWRLWQDAITIGGVSVLPQVMWSTFDPYLPPSLLPGMIALVTASVLVLLDRMKRLPKQMESFMGGLAAWSATLLFMWGPVAQMWTNIVKPSNIQGLSVFTILLAMIGNSLLLPRALFTRDVMWFTGSSWGALLQGWGILLTMYIYNCISSSIFLGVSFALALWLGGMLVMDSKAYSLPSPANPLVDLFFGSRRT
ncbi:hypothetical protein O6H91_16G002400 [Diphasiastrum complanatum]|nr:hypothetical protein O6H91_16G002400 [Diphasiastrum complanatum]